MELERSTQSAELPERRIREAAQYVPLEQLGLSGSCGFANAVCSVLDQRAKPGMVAEHQG